MCNHTNQEEKKEKTKITNIMNHRGDIERKTVSEYNNYVSSNKFYSLNEINKFLERQNFQSLFIKK